MRVQVVRGCEFLLVFCYVGAVGAHNRGEGVFLEKIAAQLKCELEYVRWKNKGRFHQHSGIRS